MKMKARMPILAGLLLLNATAFSQDTNRWIFLCFGQSNMEGFPGIEDQDKGPVDARFQVLAAVDFPDQGRTKGNWYPAVPPLCRPSAGIGPADYFGRTLVSNLPQNIKVGIVNVSIGGCKIELFEKDRFQTYAATAPNWMTNTIAHYSGNPYQHLVDMAKLAQKDGVIKGILLHQGESNNGDKEWPDKVKGIYENLLQDLNLKAEEAPLLAGELMDADQKGACAGMNKIIDDLPKTIPTAHVISSKGCAGRPDHLHFTPAGYRELGRRYAEKMLSLLGYKVAERKHPFASRWDQARGHGEWRNSRAVHAVSDNLIGSYVDKGLCWPGNPGSVEHDLRIAKDDPRIAIPMSSYAYTDRRIAIRMSSCAYIDSSFAKSPANSMKLGSSNAEERSSFMCLASRWPAPAAGAGQEWSTTGGLGSCRSDGTPQPLL
jgi:hypothetical protein